MKETILSFWRPNNGISDASCFTSQRVSWHQYKADVPSLEGATLRQSQALPEKSTGTPVPYAATMPSDVWTIDINHDSCMNGTKLRILSIVDAFTTECLALEVSTRINANKVRTVLGRCFTTRAVPRFLRSDNGGEFITRSTAMLLHED